MVDFGKCVKAATIPTVLLIGLGILGNILGFVPFLLCLAGIPILVADLAILGWAGFKAVKEEGLDMVGGVVSGAIAGSASAFVNGIIGLVLAMAGVAVNASSGLSGTGSTALDAGVTGVVGVLGIIFGVILGAIFGAVLGAVGAFVAGMKKAPAPSSKKK